MTADPIKPLAPVTSTGHPARWAVGDPAGTRETASSGRLPPERALRQVLAELEQQCRVAMGVTRMSSRAATK